MNPSNKSDPRKRQIQGWRQAARDLAKASRREPKAAAKVPEQAGGK